LSFNGKNYKGWQTQKNGQTLQATLNHALNLILKEKINVVGCGRTDTGVHAINYYAHFDTSKPSLLTERDFLVQKINRILPKDISINGIYPVSLDSSARFSALSRTYEYRISRAKNPFTDDLAYYYHGQLDIHQMNLSASIIMEYTDFTSFSKLHTQVATNNCKITEAYWHEENNMLVFTITADRFLRNMVRAIVGTLLDIGRGKITIAALTTIIESHDRSKAGMSVPAKGLFLVNVTYPPEIFN
jgi:tRNA pseudouridine38-40 synthase